MKNSLYSKISVRGQVSVPVDICRALGVQPGDSLCWSINPENTMAQVTRIQPAPPDGAKAMLGFAKTFRKPLPSTTWYAEGSYPPPPPRDK